MTKTSPPSRHRKSLLEDFISNPEAWIAIPHELALTTEEVVKYTGITEVDLKEFIRHKLVKPAQPSRGTRQRNHYSFCNAMEIKLIVRLRSIGIDRSWIRAIMFGLKTLTMRPSDNPMSLRFHEELRDNQTYEQGRQATAIIQPYSTGHWRVKLSLSSHSPEQIIGSYFKELEDGFKLLNLRPDQLELEWEEKDTLSLHVELSKMNYALREKLKAKRVI